MSSSAIPIPAKMEARALRTVVVLPVLVPPALEESTAQVQIYIRC